MPGAEDPDVTYPRDVPAPEGVPPGWKGVEKQYGPTSKIAGQTYIRYSSVDGRHSSVGSVRGIWQKHCEDNNLDFNTVYNEFLVVQKEITERKLREREELGNIPGVNRDRMIALFKQTHGDLRGPLVFSFPDWKTRWEYSPSSGQVAKTFTEPNGREWKLLLNLECFFGFKIARGGAEAEEVAKLLADANERETPAWKDWFHQGSAKARDNGGAYSCNPSTGYSKDMNEEEKAKMNEERVNLRVKVKRTEKALHDFKETVQPPQVGWAALSNLDDIRKGFVEFKRCLVAQGFGADTELVAVHGLRDSCRFGPRLTGVYYQLPETVADRACYQKLLHAPILACGVCCDGVYIIWHADKARWQVSPKPSQDGPCIAYCVDASEQFAKVSGVWKVQSGNADFVETSELKITCA